MKKLILILALVFSSLALAQAPGPNVNSGRFMAANYGQWQTQVQSTPTGKACVSPTNVVLADGSKFNPWNTNAKLLIGSGGNAETVTPTAFDFISTPGQVCISATYTKTHFFGEPLFSGTFGLQEALNAAGVIGGGAVTIDQRWAGLGGTTAMVSAAVLPTNVKIEDARTGVSSGSGSSANGTTGPQQNNWQVQTTPCGSNPNCTQIFGDTKFVIDAVTNSTNTITSASAAFTQADVGKSVWAVQRGSGNNAFSAGTLICGNSVPVPTITTVNSGSSITISGSACTGSQSNVILTWGHKDGAALAAMAPGCTSVYFPNNINVMVDQPWLISVPACASSSGIAQATGVPNLNVYGGSPSTQFVITPDFNYAGCTGTGAASGGVCMLSGVSGVTNLIVWGTGTSNASNSNCASGAGKTILSQNPLGGNLINVNMSGVCPGTGLTGIELNGIDDQWILGGAQNVGTTACAFSKAAMISKGLFCGNLGVASAAGYGADVLVNGQLSDEGTFIWEGLRVHGQLTTRNSHFIGGNNGGGDSANAVTIYSGGTHIMDGDFVGQDTGTGATPVGVNIQSGGTLVARNTKFGAAGGSNITIGVSGTFLDKGGNTQTTATSQLQDNLSLTSGDQILYGFCTGTATSSVTILPYGLGSPSTTTCTNTGTNSGWVAPRAGTLRSLTLSSTATSVSVAATVFINHNGTDAASAVTCTMTAATNCTDYTHNASYAAGDIITVRLATGAAETAANLRVNVVAW